MSTQSPQPRRPATFPHRPSSRPPSSSVSPIAPGSRILVRDAEWLVRRVDTTSSGGKKLTVVGISELVRNKEAVFLDEIDRPVVLDPASTLIVADPSPHYRASLLYMESLLRQTAPTDEYLNIGHRAAMDLVPYQLEPALQALHQPRQRILIADAVGLGKTLECGILLSELIRRGRGKRILVLAVKSMLTQFQKEMWTRFSIPLTRLDSIGIQRIRHRIPTNHNPFYYYDKAIISIDTLKQDREYTVHLENAWWDIIVVDEAHNVAERGGSLSQRAKLARLLAERSDTLIMLSATPHDGRARSFASLMNILDPTAIADPQDYGPDDIQGLFIRRFKKDIQDQVERAFKKRTIHVARCAASAGEEEVFERLTALRFARIDSRRTAGQLFKTTLEKSLFSSPVACAETSGNRVATLKKNLDPELEPDIQALNHLKKALERLGPDDFSKYQKLVEVIRDAKGLRWTGKDPSDRLVIFTERLATLEFLRENLQKDLKLKDAQVETLDGSMSDVEQQRIVEDFGRDEAPVRLLLATDVASEGINLHFLCHKMVHFDIPWSLMVFNQRNGRIDRYGQEHEPHIIYLMTDSRNEKIKGDTRILQLLIEKDQQAVENIGDPSTWMGVHDIDTEERITSDAIERGDTPEQFQRTVEQGSSDPLAALLSGAVPLGKDAEDQTRAVHTLYASDYAYLKETIEHIRGEQFLQAEFSDDQARMDITAPADLTARFAWLPSEAYPEDGVFVLSADKDVIQQELRRCRKDERAWPRIQFLWPLHPVLDWANDKVLASFGRHEAPLMTLPKGVLGKGEVVFVLSGLIPNRKSHPLVNVWFAVTMRHGKFAGVEDFKDLHERVGLGSKSFSNAGAKDGDIDALQALLPEVIKHARSHVSARRNAFEKSINVKLNESLERLEVLKKRQLAYLDKSFDGSKLAAPVAAERKDTERRRIDRLFGDFMDWVQETMTTEDNPFLQVVAVLRGVGS